MIVDSGNTYILYNNQLKGETYEQKYSILLFHKLTEIGLKLDINFD